MAEKETIDKNVLTWEASEYVHHEKDGGWYVLFVIASSVVLVGTYLIIEDIFSLIVVLMMFIAIAIVANRQPKSLRYSLDDQGLRIENKDFPYSVFKSFSVMKYGAVDSVYLEPLERFMPSISIYFAPDDGANIVDTLGSYLPHRQREPDLIERVVHRIRL